MIKKSIPKYCYLIFSITYLISYLVNPDNVAFDISKRFPINVTSFFVAALTTLSAYYGVQPDGVKKYRSRLTLITIAAGLTYFVLGLLMKFTGNILGFDLMKFL